MNVMHQMRELVLKHPYELHPKSKAEIKLELDHLLLELISYYAHKYI